MRFAAFVLAFSTIIASLAAADVTPLPAPKAEPWKELTCEVGVPVVLSAGEDVKDVTWKLIDDSTGATLTAPPDSHHAVFVASKEGRFKFACVADGKASWYTMKAGDPPPTPPGPKPPAPVPPKPVDELTKQLQAAYTADTGATKAADLRQLVALYLQAVEFANSDKTLQSAANLFMRVTGAAGSLLPDVNGVRRLSEVRKVIAGELASVLPTDPDAPLTNEVRAAAAAAFAKYAKALQGITP